MKSKIIEVKNLSFRFKKDSNDFFKNLNFDIYENEKIIIFGLNGSGKSTLAKILVGLYIACSGTINYLNSNNVSMIMQNPDNAIIGKTVEEEFAICLQNLNLTYEQMHHKFDEIVKLMHLEKYVKADINTLSGGIKQKASITSCLIKNPQVLIFDEIKNELDLYEQRKIDEIINDLWKKELKTLIFISHDLNDIFDANKIFYINQNHELIQFKQPFSFIHYIYANKLDEVIQIPDFIRLKKILNIDLTKTYDETINEIINHYDK